MMEVAYGICRLSTVPIRKNPSDAAEMVSQLLFGEHYRVLDKSGNEQWLRIQNEYDAYEGWIDQKQHEAISREFFEQINNSDYQISTDSISNLTFKGNVHRISIGSVLPLLSNPIFRQEEEITLTGGAKPIYQKLSRPEIIELGESLLNSPYLWGGRSSFGIDCSGYTQLLYRLAGYQLPRDSSQQILKGEKIELEEAKPGDLAFFNNREGRINHVGLICSDEQILHASGRVRVDKIDSNGIFNLEQNVYTHHLFMVKTYLP